MQETNTCKNCGNEFVGKYCNLCGEKIYTNKDKSILHFFGDAFHFITHFEGTFFNTLRAIFKSPGKLSLDYCNGLHKRYFKPLSFFMLLVILYLLFPRFTGLNMPFKYYLNEGQYARDMTEKKTGISMDSISARLYQAVNARTFSSQGARRQFVIRYADSVIKSYPKLAALETRYTKKSETTSKVLLLILIPLTAICLYAVAFYKRRFFYDHLVFATELNSFYLLYAFFILPIFLELVVLVIPKSWYPRITEDLIGYFIRGGLLVFASFAIRNFYKERWIVAILKAILLVFVHGIIVYQIYRFVLFAVTMYLS